MLIDDLVSFPLRPFFFLLQLFDLFVELRNLLVHKFLLFLILDLALMDVIDEGGKFRKIFILGVFIEINFGRCHYLLPLNVFDLLLHFQEVLTVLELPNLVDKLFLMFMQPLQLLLLLIVSECYSL